MAGLTRFYTVCMCVRVLSFIVLFLKAWECMKSAQVSRLMPESWQPCTSYFLYPVTCTGACRAENYVHSSNFTCTTVHMHMVVQALLCMTIYVLYSVFSALMTQTSPYFLSSQEVLQVWTYTVSAAYTVRGPCKNVYSAYCDRHFGIRRLYYILYLWGWWTDGAGIKRRPGQVGFILRFWTGRWSESRRFAGTMKGSVFAFPLWNQSAHILFLYFFTSFSLFLSSPDSNRGIWIVARCSSSALRG